MADDLRFLFCSIKIIRDLERIGDHLVTVAKKGYRINSSIPPEFIEKLEILGNGKQIKSYLDVRDGVKGVINISELHDQNSSVFNLGHFQTMNVRNLADINVLLMR